MLITYVSVVGALAYTFFFTLGTDIWVQKGRGKVGLWGNILVKSKVCPTIVVLKNPANRFSSYFVH